MRHLVPVPPTRPAPHYAVVRVNARLNVGGIARHVAWLTAGLGDDYPTLLVAGSVPDGEVDMREFVAGQGVEPLILPELTREISPRDVVVVWKLYRLFLRHRPRIVHTHAAKAGAVGRVAAWLYRWLTPGALVGRPRECKVVHTYHGHIFHSYYGRWKTWVFLTVERLLARLATDRIVVISPAQHDEIHRTFRVGRPEQFAVVPLGIDLTPYADWERRRRTLRTELGATDADVLVGIVGRLTEIKDHALFLKAAALYLGGPARDAGRRVRFLVVGDGHLRAGLEQEAAALGLGDAVAFLGMRDDPEVFYPALDVVALTSKNEGTPLSVIEGFANARAVVATDVGGVRDLTGALAGGTVPADPGYAVCDRGVLVRPGDPAAFARGLARLTDDPALRDELGRRGHAFVHARYSKDRLLADVAALYDDLLGGPGRAADPTPHPPTRTRSSDPCEC